MYKRPPILNFAPLFTVTYASPPEDPDWFLPTTNHYIQDVLQELQTLRPEKLANYYRHRHE